MRIVLLLLVSLHIGLLQADDTTYMFRLLLKDKGESHYSINNPQKFLSEKAIERRVRQGIAIDSTDLPIDTSYISRIQKTGVEIVAQSKWVKTITVSTQDSLDANRLQALPFVDTLQLVWRMAIAPLTESNAPNDTLIVPTDLALNAYGAAFSQIAKHNGQLLHEAGFKGAGITIAVFDGGFRNADFVDALNQEQILGAHAFSHQRINPYRSSSDHGTRVLSCMLSNKKQAMIGTAPEASYHLFWTEVDNAEFPVEEDYWITALEYADSIGVDIATTSLGYTLFPALPEMNHRHEELDGNTVLMSRAATMAAEKGILVLNSAGNDGNTAWQRISIPSDAEKILTVGSIDINGELSAFTPSGPTADNRIKPDIMSVGTDASIISANGQLIKGRGTSFSTPIMTGLSACLWQAFPELTNLELLELIKQSSSRYNTPDAFYGYGVPDFFEAYERGQISSPLVKHEARDSTIRHIGSYLLVDIELNISTPYKLTIYNSIGKETERITPLLYASVDVGHLLPGVYIALLEGNGTHHTCKFIVR